jgi:uncharacterized protein YjbI with pentapeptide repeats
LRADVEDSFRKTIGQLLAGVAVLAGAGLAYFQFMQQQQSSHDLLISAQVSKGFEQLGSDKPVIRLGGIYALEGVMNTSALYHQPVLEALCAFVRDNTRGEVKGDQPPATDVQATLTVIGRRRLSELETERMDLNNAHIRKANLEGANLSGTHLAEANLSEAFLVYADLHGAYLRAANLSEATLIGANLIYATLEDANLSQARLNANLSHAYLERANLSGADLSGAKLIDTDLSGTNLSGADLSRADLKNTAISQTQLDTACGIEAKLPPGLALKPCAPPK